MRPKGKQMLTKKDKNRNKHRHQAAYSITKPDNHSLRGVYLERMEERYRGVVPLNHNNILKVGDIKILFNKKCRD